MSPHRALLLFVGENLVYLPAYIKKTYSCERRRFMRGIVLILALCVSSSSVLQHARLVSIEQLPQDGETCLPEEAIAAPDLFATLKASSVYAAQSNDNRALEVNRSALRTIQDTDSIYTAVAVDSKSNEVFLQDN